MKPSGFFLAGIGWLDEAAKRIENIYEELVDRGRLRSRDSNEFIDRLIEKAQGERTEAGKIAREIRQDALDSLGIATAADIERIREKLARTEKMLDQLENTTKDKL